jgi:flagellar motor switch protein FliN/FliY
MDEIRYLSESEKDALAEFGNISMGSSATAISKLLNRKVSITTPTLWASKVADIQKRYPNPCVIVTVEYVSGLQGSNILIIKESDARIIADLMMGLGFSDPNSGLTEIQLSAVSECMNQMMGSAATALSQLMGISIIISPPELNYVDLGEGHSQLSEFINETEVVATTFKMDIEDLVESELIQVMPLDFTGQVVDMLFSSVTAMEETPDIEREPEPEPPVVTTSPVDESAALRLAMLKNLPIRVSVVLGKTKMSLGEVFQLSPGSVVELDRFENEPVDVMVNGKVVAKGEVVLVDDQFGIRVLEIIAPEEREESLRKK